MARQFLEDAANDYAGRYHQGYITGDEPILKGIDGELYDALEQWPDRPKLCAPEWPAFVVSEAFYRGTIRTSGVAGAKTAGRGRRLERSLGNAQSPMKS
jgi:hypothetical protein